MIIRLTGGLGNQMFQYAYGRSCSIKNKKQLKYFFVHYSGDTKRTYELRIFNIRGVKVNGYIPNIFVKLSHFLKINIPVVKYGNWQSQKYFSNCEKEIRDDFQFIKPLDKKNYNVLKTIKTTSSISIHFRRGDYVSDNKINKFHGVCSLKYYQKAIDYLNIRVDKPKYFVFSDDENWVKANFRLKGATYIDWNKGKNSYKDMQLMSNCKHNIIANSSFSWWAAWLNSNPQKIVVAPKKWFNNEDAQNNTRDLIPKEWIKI